MGNSNDIRHFIPDIDKLNILLKGKGIDAHKYLANTKASDYFVSVTFRLDDGKSWNTVVPYIYRRSNLNLKSEEEVADYLSAIHPYFHQKAMKTWKKKEWEKWLDEKKRTKNPEKLVTIDFFEKLLSFKEELDFPPNPNPQRRFQDIKDRGYTLSIYPIGKNSGGKCSFPFL